MFTKQFFLPTFNLQAIAMYMIEIKLKKIDDLYNENEFQWYIMI